MHPDGAGRGVGVPSRAVAVPSDVILQLEEKGGRFFQCKIFSCRSSFYQEPPPPPPKPPPENPPPEKPPPPPEPELGEEDMALLAR